MDSRPGAPAERALPGRLAAAVDAERVRDGVAPAEMLDKLAERLDKLDRLEERVSKVLALQDRPAVPTHFRRREGGHGGLQQDQEMVNRCLAVAEAAERQCMRRRVALGTDLEPPGSYGLPR